MIGYTGARADGGDLEQAIAAARRVSRPRRGVEAGIVVDAALEANPVALVKGQVSAALEANSQSVNFQVASRLGWSRMKFEVKH